MQFPNLVDRQLKINQSGIEHFFHRQFPAPQAGDTSIDRSNYIFLYYPDKLLGTMLAGV